MAFTQSDVPYTFTIGNYASTLRGVRYQGVYGNQIYEEQSGKYIHTATVIFEQRGNFTGSYDNYILNGLLTIKNDVVVTCSDNNAVFRNVQVNNMPFTDNVVSSTYIDSYVNGTGTYTASYNNRIIYDNYIMTGTNNNVYPVLKYMVVVTWESTLDDSYIQVEVRPTVSTPVIITRRTQPLADIEMKKTIIDALAESDDVQLMVDYLAEMDGDLHGIYEYILEYYPAFNTRLLNLISLQGVANDRLYELLQLFTIFMNEYLADKEHQTEVAEEVSSQIQNQQEEQSSLEAEMTYNTVDSDGFDDSANDLLANQAINQRITGKLWEWLSHPFVLPFLVTATTFSIIGFVLYGKGGK